MTTAAGVQFDFPFHFFQARRNRKLIRQPAMKTSVINRDERHQAEA